MVGAENVEKQVVTASSLLVVIGDIGGKIRGGAILTDDDPVFVVAVFGRLEPHRAVANVETVPFIEALQGAFQGSAVGEAALGIPVVRADAEFGQVLPDIVEYAVAGCIEYRGKTRIPQSISNRGDDPVQQHVVAGRRFGEDSEQRGAVEASQPVVPLGMQLSGDVVDIVTPVGSLGKLDLLAECL